MVERLRAAIFVPKGGIVETYVEIIRTIVQNSNMTSEEKDEVIMNLDILLIEVANANNIMSSQDINAKKEKKNMIYEYEEAIQNFEQRVR